MESPGMFFTKNAGFCFLECCSHVVLELTESTFNPWANLAKLEDRKSSFKNHQAILNYKEKQTVKKTVYT